MNNPFKDKKNPGVLHSSPVVRRYEANPLLTAADVPYPATVTFEDLWKVMTPCSRLAEYANIPFRLEEWQRTAPDSK